MSTSYADMQVVLDIVLRELARGEGVRVAREMLARRDPEQDALYVPFAVEHRRSMHEISIDADVFKLNRATIVDVIRDEFSRACAEARGLAVCDLLEKPVRISDEKREKLCDRLTGLIETLSKKDPALCETLALRLMKNVEPLKSR